jgi:hypothetical protein
LRIPAKGLIYLIAKIIQIRRIETHILKTGFQNAGGPAEVFAVVSYLPPLGMLFSGQIIYSGSQIDRHIYIYLLASPDLFTEKVEIQMRVHFADFGRMIAPAVMTSGKTCYRIYICIEKRLLKFLFIEPASYFRDMFGCMEIKMYLSKSHISGQAHCFLVVLYTRIVEFAKRMPLKSMQI